MSFESRDSRSVPTFPKFLLPVHIGTPAVLVDLTRLERNIERLARELERRGVALRPHAKTHNSSAVARMQLAAGASGMTVGTLSMAESFARCGFQDLFIAAPVFVARAQSERLRALHRSVQLAVGIDSPEAASMLGVAIGRSTRRLSVLIEIDSGERRSGVEPERAPDLAQAAVAAGLEVAGLFTHGGHSYLGPGHPKSAAVDEVHALSRAAAALQAKGYAPRVVSAGSTPTMLRSAVGPVNEVRPGTYVFNDRQQVALEAVAPDDVALAVAAMVISNAVPNQVVLDAGAKTLAKDKPDWLTGHGILPAYPLGLVSRLYDFHAVVEFPDGGPRPQLGEVVTVIPNHVCPVVNLSRELLLLRDGEVTGSWQIDARG